MSARPIRLQLSRAKGFNLQAASLAANGLPAVNVARPGKWGNPYRVGQRGEMAVRADEIEATPISPNITQYSVEGLDQPGVPIRMFEQPLTAAAAVSKYRAWLADRGLIGSALSELAGKNLACWCKPGAPCHADVLLDLANPARRREAKP